MKTVMWLNDLHCKLCKNKFSLENYNQLGYNAIRRHQKYPKTQNKRLMHLFVKDILHNSIM